MAIKSTLVATTASTVFLMLSPPIAAAQDDNGSALVVPREGDTYDHKDYQPTERAPSATTDQRVNDQVKALLKQSDELDRQSEEWALPGK
jgi:hypothetical protein